MIRFYTIIGFYTIIVLLSMLPCLARTIPAKNVSHALDTLIIDPGHGGSDLGTRDQGLCEKDISLIYALKLREEIEQAMPEVKVFLTREEDKYISLADRAKLANEKNANLFLSLHVNHSPKPEVRGAETYILSPNATDDEAKRTALLENDVWLKDTKIKDAGNTVRQILADMEQTKYIQDSALAGAFIQQELTNLDYTRGLKNRGVKQALFYVLSQVTMPSILVEMGFLSNASDRGRLMNLHFRDEFVKDLVTSLRRYRNKLALKEASS